MSNGLNLLYKTGGISFIISGILFLIKGFLDFMAGPPPSSGVEILAWMASSKLPLEFVSETTFFAGSLLAPGTIALYYSLASTDRSKAAIGCSFFAVTIPVIALVLPMIHGRLVYPVFNIMVNTPAIAEFAIALYYGGLHGVGLLIGFATLILSLAMLKSEVYGRNIAFLGFVTGIFDIIGIGYPYAIGPIPALVSQILFAAWFLAVGAKLYRMRPRNS